MPGQAQQPLDQELIAAVLGGDRDGFGKLVERHQGRLVNYLFRLLRNLDEAHDVAQEVFLKVYQALDRYDPSFKFSTWMFRIAKNTAIDKVRKRRVKLVSMYRPEDEEGGERDWEFASPEPSPYRAARHRERGDAIQDAIDGLP